LGGVLPDGRITGARHAGPEDLGAVDLDEQPPRLAALAGRREREDALVELLQIPVVSCEHHHVIRNGAGRQRNGRRGGARVWAPGSAPGASPGPAGEGAGLSLGLPAARPVFIRCAFAFGLEIGPVESYFTPRFGRARP